MLEKASAEQGTFLHQWQAEGRSFTGGGLWPPNEVRRKGVVRRVNHRGFCRMDMLRGSSKEIATRSGEHCPAQRFQRVDKRSGRGGGVRKAGSVDLLRSEGKGVLCKAEDNKWVAWESPVPLKVLSSQLPLITFRNLITYGERKEVGGRAVRKADNHREEDPVAKRGKLVCQLVAS